MLCMPLSPFLRSPPLEHMSAWTVPGAGQEGLYWEGEEGVNCGLPIFWVDQKQSSFRVGKRKLKIYCSKKKNLD